MFDDVQVATLMLSTPRLARFGRGLVAIVHAAYWALVQFLIFFTGCVIHIHKILSPYAKPHTCIFDYDIQEDEVTDNADSNRDGNYINNLVAITFTVGVIGYFVFLYVI